MRKTISFIAILMLISFVACSPIEDYFVGETQRADTIINGPLTDVEYTNKVNRIIVPHMSEGETYMSHHLSILRGNYPIKQEIASIKNSIDKVQEDIEELDKIYQPSNRTEDKMETIQRLNEYKDALLRYQKALEGEKESGIKEAADYLNAVLASLKTVHGLY